MSTREQILQALRRSAFDAPLPPPFTAGSPPVTRAPEADLTARFLERASAAGASVQVVDHAELGRAVTRAISAVRARRVVAHDDAALAPVMAALREQGVSVLAPEEHTRDALAGAEVGVTAADYGIAETGTLVLAAGVLRPRAVSLLPRLHVAVLPEERICATVFDLMARLREVPSAWTCITGPSRTADIELTPVRGAHGPVSVAIFIVQRMASPRSP